MNQWKRKLSWLLVFLQQPYCYSISFCFWQHKLPYIKKQLKIFTSTRYHSVTFPCHLFIIETPIYEKRSQAHPPSPHRTSTNRPRKGGGPRGRRCRIQLLATASEHRRGLCPPTTRTSSNKNMREANTIPFDVRLPEWEANLHRLPLGSPPFRGRPPPYYETCRKIKVNIAKPCELCYTDLWQKDNNDL